MQTVPLGLAEWAEQAGEGSWTHLTVTDHGLTYEVDSELIEQALTTVGLEISVGRDTGDQRGLLACGGVGRDEASETQAGDQGD